jgi:hypothetical protein
MKVKKLTLVMGMILMANVGFAQTAKLDEITEIPAAVNQNNQHTVIIDPYVKDDIISLDVNGIEFDKVKHFTINGQVIDDFVREGRNNGTVTVTEQQDFFFILVSLPFAQSLVGGTLGIVMSNGTTVTSKIFDELPSRLTRCYARYKALGHVTDRVYLGTIHNSSQMVQQCVNKAKNYVNHLHYSQFKGLTEQRICQEGWLATVNIDAEVSDQLGSDKDGELTSGLKAVCLNNGTTWGKYFHDSVNGIDRVGCHAGSFSCNLYQGDTSCNTELPVLCLKQDGSPRPNYAGIPPTDGAMPKEYNGWAGGHISLTLPMKGTRLTSLNVANATCATAFGNGYRMAEFHDGKYVSGMDLKYGATWPPASQLQSGAWNFYAYGNVSDASRFWIRVNDLTTNCWDITDQQLINYFINKVKRLDPTPPLSDSQLMEAFKTALPLVRKLDGREEQSAKTRASTEITVETPEEEDETEIFLEDGIHLGIPQRGIRILTPVENENSEDMIFISYGEAEQSTRRKPALATRFSKRGRKIRVKYFIYRW